MEKWVQWHLERTTMRFEKYRVKRILWKKHHINYHNKLLAWNETYIILITIIYHSVWSFNITFTIMDIIMVVININIVIISAD